jgi:hypothetical protein
VLHTARLYNESDSEMYMLIVVGQLTCSREGRC